MTRKTSDALGSGLKITFVTDFPMVNRVYREGAYGRRQEMVYGGEQSRMDHTIVYL
jgi:hypothetical protein